MTDRGKTPATDAATDALIAELRGVIADLRADRDVWREQAQRLALPTLGLIMETRRFPPPWSVDEADSKLDWRCLIVRDANGQALAYVYFEGDFGGTSTDAR